jgi:hypothetical protein
MEGIIMSKKELDRMEIFSQLLQKRLTQKQAADILQISDRHVRRLFHAYKKLGAMGVLSRKRGRRSNHQLPQSVKEQS